MYSLEFRAWIGHKDDIDTNDPVEFISLEFQSLEAAKMVINGQDCIKWNDGEYANQYITISFKHEPKIFNEEGDLVCICRMTDFEDYEFDWIDI
jgi:hypothetical protein